MLSSSGLGLGIADTIIDTAGKYKKQGLFTHGFTKALLGLTVGLFNGKSGCPQGMEIQGKPTIVDLTIYIENLEKYVANHDNRITTRKADPANYVRMKLHQAIEEAAKLQQDHDLNPS